MKTKWKKSSKIMSLVLTLLMIFTLMPAPAYAAYGDGITDKFTLYVEGKDGNDIQAGEWTYYEDPDVTLKDDSGEEPSFISSGSIVYSGQDAFAGCARIGIATKYIVLEDLMEYAADEMGFDIGDEASIAFKPADSPDFGSSTVYGEKYGLSRYYFPSYIISQTFTTNGGIVPTVLAIKSWNTRNNDSSKGITADGGYVISDDTTLIEGISLLEGKADDYNALRLFMGQQDGDSSELNLGGEALKWITDVRITPVYYDLSVVTDGAVTVIPDDGYFTAASGESVSFTLSGIASGKKANVSIKDASNNEYSVTKSGSTYTFTMPNTNAAIHVNISDMDTWDGTVDTSWYNSADTCFSISTQEELAGMADLVNGGNDFSGKKITLNNDIALNEDNLYTSEDVYFQDSGTADFSGTFPVPTINASAVLWTPAGTSSKPFLGTFDGDGHTISGLYTEVANSYQGLFGMIGTGGCVKNVTVSGVVAGNQYVGGIAGFAASATIENAINNAVIYASGGASAGGSGISRAGHVGGILGMGTGTSSSPVTITKCVNNGSVTVPNCNKGGRAGGITGIFDSSSDYALISQCANHGTIKAYQYAGGIVGGQFASNVTVAQCYNTGDVTGTSSGKNYVGGIIGKSCGPIENCYNTGDIYSTATSGSNATRFAGIAGETEGTSAKINNCYSLGTINWPDGRTIGSSGNIVGSQAVNPTNCYYLEENSFSGAGDSGTTIAKTGTEFKDTGMIALLSEYFSVDTEDDNNGYPVFRWQKGLQSTPALYSFTVDPDLDPVWSVEVDSSGISGSAIYDDSPVTVTVTRSDKAYESSLADLVVEDSHHQNIAVEAGTPVSGGYDTVKSCSYCFTMPESAVTISLTADYEELKLYTQVGTESAVLVKTYSRKEMHDLATHSAVYYTGYDSKPAAVIGKAEQCVTLNDLLDDASLNLVSGCSIKLNTVDTYPTTFTYQDLLSAGRYYYPNIYSETDKTAGRTPMDPILVIKGYQSRFEDFSAGEDIDDMMCDTLNTYRFVFGQTETQFNNGVPDIQYKTVGNFAKWVNSLTIVYPETNKTALINAINEANANKSTVTVSTDGTDVLTSGKWVSSVVMETYSDAITAAQTVVNDPSAAQVQIENAITTLESATSLFNAAKASGTKKTSSGGGGSSGGSGSDNEDADLQKDSSGAQKAVAVTNATAKTDTSGTAKVTVSSNNLSSAFKSAQESAENADNKAGSKEGTTAVEVKVEVKAAASAKAVETTLPADTLQEMSKQENTMLTVSSPVADITLDQDALAAIADKAGSQVTISAEKIDNSTLPAEVKEKIGDAPVYDLKVMGSSGTVSDFKSGKATVSVPYELKDGESASRVAVYYINDAGDIVKMNCAYDPATKTATFTTDHFSYYAVVVEDEVTDFTDVKQMAYYYDAVNFAVKEGLFNGTGTTTFSPDAGMTRAMFVTTLGRASDVNAADYGQSSFRDVAAGSWYGGYVQWAYENRIISGIGDGKFAPEQQITRAQMAAVLTNYSKWKGTASEEDVHQLTYADLAEIPAWAKEGVSFCTGKGWLSGYPDGSFQPQKTATRAEAATVLYKGSGSGLLK